MSVHDEQNSDGGRGDKRRGDERRGDERRGDGKHSQHFDEVEAARHFPSEEEWLDLPAPDLGSEPASSPESSAEAATPEATSFADRVMRAREEEQALDAQLADLHQALPNDLLQQFTAPTPSKSFVEDTVATVMNDRRNRWQQMLSRYVAPEPSPVFVSRTLTALRRGEAQDGAQQDDHTQTAAAGRQAGPNSAPHSPRAQLPYTPLTGKRSNWPVFGLIAAAAAAILWLQLTDAAPAPLELRLADQASPAVAYGNATSPMAAILARVAHDEEPFSVFDAPADGLWLVSTTGDLR